MSEDVPAASTVDNGNKVNVVLSLYAGPAGSLYSGPAGLSRKAGSDQGVIAFRGGKPPYRFDSAGIVGGDAVEVLSVKKSAFTPGFLCAEVRFLAEPQGEA